MSAQQDSVALDWIKGEIRETLLQAQQALVAVAEAPDDATSMRLCLTAIHQVHGTLKMVELPGGIQLAAEMEELAQALMNNSVPDIEQAQEILMQNILQLPGYLDRVQQEHDESQEFVEATVNDLRVARGVETLIGTLEPAELVPNIELINAAPDSNARENYIRSGGDKVIRKLRQRYQQALVELLKRQNQRENLGLLAKIFSMLAKATSTSPVSHLSLLAVAVVEGIANGSIKLDARIASALRHIDPVLKTLVAHGEEGLQEPVSEELLNILILKIASDAKETHRVVAIKQTYLNEVSTRTSSPDSRSLGPDSETMSVVAKVLLEELIILKDKLDLYVRASPKSRADIEGLIPGLEKFDSSMMVIGMSQNQQVLQEQADLLKAALAEADEPSESVVLEIAAAFIKVETSLSTLVVPDGSEIKAEVAGDLSAAEASVIKEVRNGLAQCKDGVIDYISSDWDKSKMTELPSKLMELRGGLRVVNQTRPADVLLACAEYVSKGILAISVIPDLEAMDNLADSITSIDYFFERYLDNSAEPYLQMLEVAEASVARLGYSVEDSLKTYQQALSEAEEEVGAELTTEEPDTAEPEAVEDVASDTTAEPVIEEIQAEETVSVTPATEEIEQPPVLEEVFAEPEIEEPVVGQDEEEVAAEPPTEELEVDSQIETPAEVTEDEIDIEEVKIPASDLLSEELETLAADVDTGNDLEVEDDFKVGEFALEELDEDIESEGEEELQGFETEEIEFEEQQDFAESLEVEEFNKIEEVSFDEADLDQEEIEPTTKPVAEKELAGEPEPVTDAVDEDEIIEDEIVEIFVEEAKEVLETIEEFYAAWKANSADREALTEIKRAFHTLKGSGRMVGATVFGELAWAIETMLAKVLDQTITVGPEMITLMDEVLKRMPVATEAFENKKQNSVDLSDLEDRASKLASGEALSAEPEVVQDKITETGEQVEVAELEVEIIKEIAAESAQVETPEPDLVDIFVGEAADLMQVFEAFITRAERGPISFTAELRAALHTLKGSSSMAEISNIAPIAVQLDGLTSQLIDRNIKTDEQITALLKRGHELISEALGSLHLLTLVPIDGTDVFLAELEDLRSSRVGDSDAEIESVEQDSQIFSFDGIDSLLESDAILAQWQADELSGLLVELDLLIKRSHNSGKTQLNSLVSCLRAAFGPLSISHPPAEIVLVSLKRGHDHLIETLDRIAAGQNEKVDESIITTLKNLSESDEEDLLSAEPIHFVQEAWLCLNNMDTVVQQWKEDIHNSLELEKLYDYVNSISKLAQTADERIMVELCDRILLVCSGLKNGELTPVDSDPPLFESCQQQLVDFLTAVQQTEDLRPNENLLLELDHRAEASEEAKEEEPKPGVETEVEEQEEEEIDEEILSIFLEEADELVESIDQSILQWNGQRADSVPLNNLLRYLHTIKGGARLAGLSSLGEFAHNFETDLINVQQGKVPIDDRLFADLNKGQDEINRRIEIYRKMAAGKATAKERASVTRTPTAQQTEDVAVSPATAPATAADAKVSKPQAEEPKPPKAASQQQEVVRVSAELLDDLVGMAGESSITRGLIEQQINDFGDNIDELELTIDHIRDQVRRLEIETESRETMFRSRGVGEPDSEFDELEMDQYSQLQEISRSLAEGVSDLLEHKETLKSKSRDAEILLQQLSRISNEIQEGLTRTTMVPFSRMIPRLRRIVRQISDELGKKVRFDAFNIEGELDRNVLERIVAPLEHMLRNAVDHGVESIEVRKKLGKAEEGRISLRLSREAGYFVLKIGDDGSGIDIHKVRRKAIEKGLLSEDAQVTNQEVMSFVMRAGFSTAEKLTQISGRGVGMDVVDSEIKQLGGTVSIDSTPGKGTEFTIRIPFTVSITRALMVNVGDEVYAIPLNSIEGIVRVSPYELEAYYQPDAPKFEYARQAYKLVYMGRVLEKSGDPDLEGQIALLPVLLARSGDIAVAFQVDRVIGSREVVVKSIGPQFNEVTGISGASILGDGSVVVILDLMALLRASYESGIEAEYVPEEPVEVIERVRTVMVVDDSVTVRKVTSRLIERHGWDVILAKDGIDAMDQLQEILPDIMLLDIEMPRMDGFEVLRTVRHDDRIKDLPIVMITSRTGEKHKKQAMELGVDRYLGKPFQESNLISTIEEVLAQRKG
ncbi:MAG: Hpt domain-containing protein [Gammaproteobacteria bacterium]|nr:Hpt domain-containing protein [Gammaproteobacteria bacterium]